MNNRQPGRRRGRGSQRPQGGGNAGRDGGNRIDNRARGNAAQLLEKYKNLAADAQRSGDRVNTEYYLQFADHYFRVLDAGRARFEETRRPRDEFSDDEDGMDEFDGEGESTSREDRPDQDRPRDDRPRDDRPRDDRPREDRLREDREDRPRAERTREDRPRREGREERQPRDDRPSYEARDRRDERGDRSEGESRQSGAMQGEPNVPGAVDTASGPDAGGAPSAQPSADARPVRKRATRTPRREAEHASEEPAALDADRLPPSLSAEAGAEERPRRRRRVRTEGEELPPVA